MVIATAAAETSRREVLRFRFHRHQLDRDPAQGGDVDLLDYGVQDTGPDGAAWALAVRGAPVSAGDELPLAWTLRAAPHAYRRADLAAVAVATAPLSEADARKRIFDAWKPLRVAGIEAIEALRTVAGHLRDIVERPTVKGEVSARLTGLVPPPYLRACRPCATTHVYENTFRLAALQAGLELVPGTSPPVLRRIPGLRPPLFEQLGGEAEGRFDVVRAYLRFYGPARVGDAAAFLDAPVKEVRSHWPADALEVRVADDTPAPRQAPRFVLAGDAGELAAAGDSRRAGALRLVGPYDPYLQLRDRELLVADEAHRKLLWPVLGRPGAVVLDGEILGTWRPRSSGAKLGVLVAPWAPLTGRRRSQVAEQAERLAARRGSTFSGVVVD